MSILLKPGAQTLLALSVVAVRASAFFFFRACTKTAILADVRTDDRPTKTRVDLEARERTAQAWIEAVSGKACVAYETKQFARNLMRWVGGWRERRGED